MKTILFFFFLLIKINCFSQITTWSNSYGGSNSDCANSIVQLNDNTYIVAGYTRLPSLYYSMYLVRIDVYGNKMWEKTYGLSSTGSTPQVTANYIQLTNDNNIIVAATDNNNNMWILKISPVNGNVIWEKHYPAKLAYCIQSVNGGGYIVTGAYYNGADYDLLVMKLDNSGSEIWTKNYGGSLYDNGYSIQQTLDNGYIVAGKTFSYGSGDSDNWLLKLNHSGDTLWTRYIGTSGQDFYSSVVETDDSCYFLTGSIANASMNIVKYNANGDLIFNNFLQCGGGASYGSCIQKTNDKGFIVSAYCQNLLYDYVLCKLDSAGQLIWHKFFGGNANDYAYAVIQANDLGYVVVGESSSYCNGYSDMWVLKVDTIGNLTVISENNTFISTNIYPNPANNNLIIETLPLKKESMLIICTINGQELLRQQIKESKTMLDISNLTSGIYIVKLITDSNVEVRKIIKK